MPRRRARPAESFAEARARRERANADLSEMQAARLRGELLPADEVSRAVTGAFARVRLRVLALPTKAAPRLVGKESAAEVQALLTGYVEEALAELAEMRVVAEGEDMARGEPSGAPG